MATEEKLEYFRTAERPALEMWIPEPDGTTLVDFSTGYTFEFKLGEAGEAAVLTKTSGITGAAGSGTEIDGTPNIVISFAADELDNIPAGTHRWQLRATTAGNLNRVYQGWFELLDVVT